MRNDPRPERQQSFRDGPAGAGNEAGPGVRAGT